MDYQITSAPLISRFAERNHREKYVKVQDDVRGYILKKYDPKTNKYSPVEIVRRIPTESPKDGIRRLHNFSVYSPFLFIHSHDKSMQNDAIVFENSFDKSLDELTT